MVMIASDFVNEIDNIPTLTNTRIDELFLPFYLLPTTLICHSLDKQIIKVWIN